MNTDPLDHEQRVRAGCVYEAIRALMSEDPWIEDVVAVADYIYTGRVDPNPGVSRSDVAMNAASTWARHQAVDWKPAHEFDTPPDRDEQR